MQFRQSAVRQLTRETAVERSATIPRDVQPALLGTGEITLAFDPLGMQGYDVSIGQYRDSMTLEGHGFLPTYHLHLYRDEALSEHYRRKVYRSTELITDWYSHLPCGYLTYDLLIDGAHYDTVRMLDEGRDWERSFSPKTGELTTAFSLGPMRICWKTNMAREGVVADFRFDAVALDGQTHTVEVCWQHVLRLRNGAPIATGGIEIVRDGEDLVKLWRAATATSTEMVYQPVTVNWALVCTDTSITTADDETIALRWQGEGRALSTGFRLISGSDRDGTDSVEAVVAQSAAFRTQGIDAALAEAVASWQAYFADAADIEFGDEGKEYLLAMSQYVLKAGVPWHSGAPLGNLWSRKFMAMTFWDTFYAADGMLRAGHVEEVRQFGRWLVRTMQPAGRPHSWMTWYDGTSGANAENDAAYINCLAFAGILIRLAEFSGSQDDLTQIVYPYLDRLAAYLSTNAFAQGADGSWGLCGEVAGDVGIEKLQASEQTDTLIWAVMTIAKAVGYAERLGQRPAWLADASAIRDWFTVHPVKPDTHTIWYPWLPYLAPAGPYADYSQWWDGRSVDVYEKFLTCPVSHQWSEKIFRARGRPMGELPVGNYMGMPWSHCSTAASFQIAGHPDLALEFFDGTFKYVSGLGYFTESPYEVNVGGHCPYLPSHGAYLSASQLFVVNGSLWDNTVEICMGLPLLQRGSQVRWRNVWSLNGVRTSGYYTPSSLHLETASEHTCRLNVRIPFRIAGEPMTVLANGQPVDYAVDGETIILDAPAGAMTLEIRRDLATPHDILLIESFDFGARVCRVLERSGTSVRWVRDFDAIPLVIEQAKVIVLNISYVDLPDAVITAVTRAVERGAVLIAQYHAGVTRVQDHLAEFLGVNADYPEDWVFAATPRQFALSDAGHALLSQLPERFPMDVVQEIIPDLAADVEVLAMDETIGQPALTRRPMGQGWAIWMSPGCKQQDISSEVLWALAIVREVFTKGKRREEYGDLTWLESSAWQQLMLGLIDAHCDR